MQGRSCGCGPEVGADGKALGPSSCIGASVRPLVALYTTWGGTASRTPWTPWHGGTPSHAWGTCS